jgi:hypothetical protein
MHPNSGFYFAKIYLPVDTIAIMIRCKAYFTFPEICSASFWD